MVDETNTTGDASHWMTEIENGLAEVARVVSALDFLEEALRESSDCNGVEALLGMIRASLQASLEQANGGVTVGVKLGAYRLGETQPAPAS